MTNEDALHTAVGRAARAEALLRDELLTEGFLALEGAYTAAWRATTIGDVAGREKLFLAINIVGKVRDHLGKIIADGKLAQRELQAIADATERKKRFGMF
jgi:hypothetical protein